MRRVVLLWVAAITLTDSFPSPSGLPSRASLRQGGRACSACSKAAGDPGSLRPPRRRSDPVLMVDKVVKDHGGSPEFCLGVLGDLHLDETDMDLHNEGRGHMVEKLHASKNAHLVSLGDLGAYGEAGTSKQFAVSRKYLDSYNVPFDIVTGNHDLEGMQEFETDEENLEAWMQAFGKRDRMFCTEIAHKTLCVGLSTVRFRSAQYSSHEVYVDEAQIDAFETVLKQHPAEEGWNVLVFSHAPIMGCNLRALQDVHIKNACAWINHTDEKTRIKFIELCHQHKCIRAWLSGHFHLSHDYKEAISTGGSGQAFCQTGVMGDKSTRDGRRQSRLLRGDEKGIQVYSVNHHSGGTERLDMEIVYGEEGAPPQFIVPEDQTHYITPSSEGLFSARVPTDGDVQTSESGVFILVRGDDGCYLENFYENSPGDDAGLVAVGEKPGKVCWWHMADGKVLGLHDGLLVEYDPFTHAPLGIVLTKEQLAGKEVLLADGGQAAMLFWEGEDGPVTTVIHPNDDGSYYRRFQRNKLRRTEEKKREELAKAVAARLRSDRTAGTSHRTRPSA